MQLCKFVIASAYHPFRLLLHAVAPYSTYYGGHCIALSEAINVFIVCQGYWRNYCIILLFLLVLTEMLLLTDLVCRQLSNHCLKVIL
jgi:hypothetical protein